LDLQELVIAKNDHEQVFVKLEFALRALLVLQRVLVLPVVQRVQRVQQVQVSQLLQPVQVLPQPLVLVVFHRVVLLQLVHLLKKSKKKMNLKNLGYRF
jgi:hypothetical protein